MLSQGKKVAAYARVSTASDTQLESLDAQISYYRNYINQKPGWEFSGVFVDEGLTGTKKNRPGLNDLLSKCRSGEIDLVITKSISRFARNTVDLLSIVRELREHGIGVLFEKENIHTLHAEGELMLSILASFAQEESRSMSQNKRWANKKRFEDGELVGLTHLYGYDIADGEVVVNPHEARIVKMIYKDYLSGLQSKEIAEKLNAMGEPRKRGGKWRPHDITLLFRNEKHTGNALLNKRYTIDPITKETTYNKGEQPFYLVENSHEGIVSQELYDAVQAEIKNRTSNKNSAKKHNKPFTKMIRCGACGANFSRKKTVNRVFWRCSRNLGILEGECGMKGIPEENLEAFCLEILDVNVLDAKQVKEQIAEIIVPRPNVVEFVMPDGCVIQRTWEDRSRSESWTPEMRAEVARKNKLRRKK